MLSWLLVPARPCPSDIPRLQARYTVSFSAPNPKPDTAYAPQPPPTAHRGIPRCRFRERDAHDNQTTSLQEYALVNGHEYLFDSASYFPTDANAPFIESKDDEQTWLTDRLYHPSMKHIAVLLRAILHELSKDVDSRVRWIWSV